MTQKPKKQYRRPAGSFGNPKLNALAIINELKRLWGGTVRWHISSQPYLALKGGVRVWAYPEKDYNNYGWRLYIDGAGIISGVIRYLSDTKPVSERIL